LPQGALKTTINKVLGFTKKHTEQDLEKLLYIVKNEADLMKLSAYNSIYSMYKKAIKEDEPKLLDALLQAIREIVKYYLVTFNIHNAEIAFAEGFYYVHKCFKLNAENEEMKYLCHKRKVLLKETILIDKTLGFSYIVKKCFDKAYEKAFKYNKNDIELQYTDTKIKFTIKS